MPGQPEFAPVPAREDLPNLVEVDLGARSLDRSTPGLCDGDQGRLGEIWHADELFITIRSEWRYLWRVVDQDGGALDIFVTCHRDKRPAKSFFRRVLKQQETPPQLPWDVLQ